MNNSERYARKVGPNSLEQSLSSGIILWDQAPINNTLEWISRLNVKNPCNRRSGEPPGPISLDKLNIAVTYVYDNWREKWGGRGGYTRNVKSRNPNILYDHNRKRGFFSSIFSH